MSLSRDAVAQWMWQHHGGPGEGWDIIDAESREPWLKDADEFALKFKLPLDASGPGITRCRCGHPVGEHREGLNACRGQSPGRTASEDMVPCKCQHAKALAE